MQSRSFIVVAIAMYSAFGWYAFESAMCYRIMHFIGVVLGSSYSTDNIEA